MPMKKLTITTFFALCTIVSAFGQDDKKIPVNTMSVELNLGYMRDFNTYYANDQEYAKGPDRNFTINPMFRLPVNNKYNVGLGITYASDKQTQTNSGSNSETEISSGLFGPSLSVMRYCDPCWSEEDCIKFYTFLGFNFDYLSGDRDYQFTMGSISNHETGKIRSTFAGLNGGVAYKIAPNILLQGSLNLAKYRSTRTIYDNTDKDNYETENHFGLLRGTTAGIRINF